MAALFPPAACLALLTAVSPTDRPDVGAQRLVAAFKAHAPRLGVAVFRCSVSANGPSVPRWRLVDGCRFARRYVHRHAVPLEPPALEAPLVVGDGAQAFARKLFPGAPDVPAALLRLGRNRLLMVALRDPLSPDDAAALAALAGPLGAAFDAAEALLLHHYEVHADRMTDDLIRESPAALLLEARDGTLRLANQAFCDLVGLDEGPEFPVGMTIDALDAHLAPVYRDVVETHRTNRHQTTWTVHLHDGRTLECHANVLLGGRGGRLWYYRDVTARTSKENEREQTRRFYERILSALPADLAVFDADGRYIFITPSAVADPRRRDEMLGMTDRDYGRLRGLPEAVAEQRELRFQLAVATHTPQRFEESFRDRFGRMRHFMRFHAPVVDDAGELLYVIGYGLDVTAQREANDALALSEALKRGIVESSLDGIVTMDQEGRILDFNPAAERIFGHRAEAVVGLPYGEVLLAPSCRDACRNRMRSFFEGGSADGQEPRMETTGLRASGEVFPLEAALSLVHVDNRAPVMTATLRDITARRTAEAERAAHRNALADANARLEQTVQARTLELRDALERANEAGRLKDTILQNLTHEFRTPLAAILGSAAILHDETSGTLHDFTSAITQGGHRLLGLLDAVVELSHLQAGLLVPAPKRACLVAHVREALAAVRPRAHAKGLAVEYGGLRAPLPHVFDAALLKRMLHHLLDNAVKFTPAGNVTLRVESDAAGIVVEVSDTGIGMDAAFLLVAGTPFHQASSGLTRSHEGAGVGLAVAQGLAALLGTTLVLDSRPGGGTRVRFVLPAAASPLPRNPAPSASPADVNAAAVEIRA